MGMGPRTSMVIRAEEEAARFGFVRTRGFANDRHRLGWEIKCSKCPKEYRSFWPIDVPPEQMVKTMRVRQWDVGRGMRPLCPECAHNRNKGPEAKPDSQSFEAFIPPPPDTVIYHQLLTAAEKTAKRKILADRLDAATVGLVLATEDLEHARAKAEEIRKAAKEARRAERTQRREARRLARLADEAAEFRRKASDLEHANANDEGQSMTNPSLKITHTIFQLLDSVFDSNKKTYRAGYNDARVAKDVGTTEEIVAKLRIEVYGELAEDPRIQAIKDDISLLEMQHSEMCKNTERAIRDLTSRLEQLRANIGK